MTNEALYVILEQLCDQARNSAQAALGDTEFDAGEFDLVEFQAVEIEAAEFQTDRLSDARRPSAATGRAGIDQLLRSLDDVRELLSVEAPPPAALEEFDLDRCAGEIIEALNLTSGLGRDHMVLEARSGPLLVTQDRRTMEQLLTRVLDAAFKLARSSGVGVRLGAGGGEHVASSGQKSAGGGPPSPRLYIDVRDADLALRLTKWLNAGPSQADFEDTRTVSLKLAVMVAGRHLTSLGGAAELERAASGSCAVALDLPSAIQCPGRDPTGAHAIGHPGQPEALQVLVAEDSDESFVLSALLLQNERVWRAHDGAEALTMIRKQRFDFVLMDVHMPGMDGYAAIRGIRDWETQTGNARTPIVVLSADELETQRRSAAQCGCSGFLRKPLRQTDLTILLDRLKQVRMPAA